MDFWQGMIIGIFIGANTGVVIAALCKACKRGFEQSSGPATWPHMDEAVMEEALEISPDPSFRKRGVSFEKGRSGGVCLYPNSVRF